MLSKIKRILLSVEVKITVVVGILIIILFAGYLKFIGLPATNSQNIFNEGVKAYNEGDLAGAEELFQEADNLWPHSEVEDRIKQIDDLSNLH